MIVFNLDAKPQSQDLRFCCDYSAKIIRSAISIPLLKYNRSTQKLESALCNIEYIQKNKIVLSINEFWFEDGEKLQPSHIKNTIEYLLKEDAHSRCLLPGINKIIIKNDCIVIYYKSNVRFAYALTNIKFSPFNNNGCFCGKYKIKDYNDNYIIVESNKYNSQYFAQIKFNFEGNNIKDIKSYYEGNADFTNPTTFPLSLLDGNAHNLNCYNNYIFFNLSFTNRKLLTPCYKELREIIYHSICREEIVNKMHPLINVSYNFLISKNNGLNSKNLGKYKEPIYLTLGYDDFYPNREICKFIINELEKRNIFLILKKTDFYTRYIKYDLQLNINTPDYYDDSFYYCSKYFELIIKLSDKNEFKHFKRQKNMFIKTGNQDYLKKICQIVDNLYVEIPIFVGNAVYLSKYKNFNFVDLNFECFDIDKF